MFHNKDKLTCPLTGPSIAHWTGNVMGDEEGLGDS